MATKTPIDETVEVETKTGKTVYVRVADLSKAELDPASRMTMRNISGSTPYKTGKGWLAAWCDPHPFTTTSQVKGGLQYECSVTVLYTLPDGIQCQRLSACKLNTCLHLDDLYLGHH